jgi:hypothetical protein
MLNQSFQFNGKTYQSLEDLPEEFKSFFKDENKNGIPDIFENMQNFANQGNFQTGFNSTQYFVNGKSYNSLDEVPENEQDIIKNALGNLNLNFSNPTPSSLQNISSFSQTNPGEPKHFNQTQSSPTSTASWINILLGVFFILIVLLIYWGLR